MMTAALLREWELVDHPANPPTAGRIPQTMAYLVYYTIDIKPPKLTETSKKLARRLYSTI
jgi:hypothetical protein